MIKRLIVVIIAQFLLITSAFAYDGSISMSGEYVDINGYLRFPDGSTASTAMGSPGPPGPPGQSIQGPQGIQGVEGPAGPPGPSGPDRYLYVNRLSISDFQPIWFTQGNNWQAFSPAVSLTFNKVSSSSVLRVTWSDNVGIFGPSWCNVGLFIDTDSVTSCTGSWSGVSGTTVFNQQSISCVITAVPLGSHIVSVKHRSQYCVYGNYAFDNLGLNRFITVEEQN